MLQIYADVVDCKHLGDCFPLSIIHLLFIKAACKVHCSLSLENRGVNFNEANI